MTAPGAFRHDMNPFMLDAATAERLVTGAVGVDDAPPSYRGVSRLLQALREAPDEHELAGAEAAVNRISAIAAFERRGTGVARSRRSPARAVRIAAASVVSCCILSGGLAAAGALPESAQRVASAVLRQVGISVPAGDEQQIDRDPAPTTSAPAPTTGMGSVQPMPTDDAPDKPRSEPKTSRGAPEPRPAPVDRGASPAGDPSPPAVDSSGNSQSPEEAPPGNGQGNAYGVGNGNAHANGHANSHGNPNGNAYGLDKNGNGSG